MIVKQEKIAKVNFAEISLDDALWTAEDIGEYLKISTHTVQMRIAIKPGFPCAIIPANGSKRWIAREVINWMKNQRG